MATQNRGCHFKPAPMSTSNVTPVTNAVGTFGSLTQRLCAGPTARRPDDERHSPSSRPVGLPSRKL